MKCEKCGNDILDGEKFCSGCGAKTEYADLNYGTLVVTRKSSIFGCAIPFKVFIDGKLKDKVSNGKTITLEIPYGTHKVSFNKADSKVNRVITISEDKKTIKFTIKVNLFAISFVANAKIVDIE